MPCKLDNVSTWNLLVTLIYLCQKETKENFVFGLISLVNLVACESQTTLFLLNRRIVYIAFSTISCSETIALKTMSLFVFHFSFHSSKTLAQAKEASTYIALTKLELRFRINVPPRNADCLGIFINLLSNNLTKLSNTLIQFVGKIQQIVWLCLIILWGSRLKG